MKPTLIDDPQQIALLASPLRQELVDTLAALGGQASVATLAEQLGRPADGLYYHLQLLAEGGLVQEVVGAAGERRFSLVGGPGPRRLGYSMETQAARDALRVYAKGLLQVAGQDFQAALNSDVVVSGERRTLWAARNKGWLSAGELVEVNALLERLCELTSQPRGEEREHLVSLAFVLAPTTPKGKRRSKRSV
ncbi:helix-turn-helix domain-containing protein [Stenotrophomonas sp. Iso1]|uniref:winged helix-turn-helix domain-containing protein n=1 Tax=Stenotrophomonas sp. Iso1 TaxID=2977283 RepID=UPI0022B78DE2|nr:helix-turn-helix domain-containing protein [Stenotrophomonas sp. Iso1]